MARASLSDSIIVEVFDDKRKDVTEESNPAVATTINLDKYAAEPVHSTCDPWSWWMAKMTLRPRLLCCVVSWPPQFPAKYCFRKQDGFYVWRGAKLNYPLFYSYMLIWKETVRWQFSCCVLNHVNMLLNICTLSEADAGGCMSLPVGKLKFISELTEILPTAPPPPRGGQEKLFIL